ncbi:glycerophosphodiester phosphodiesterase family protein [Micromonospora sp. DT15]|uniref:glycerophosphodiester phosphodiesterase family protein n=1 Tax=Micromonospora sp. DT15 TaxID=3393445 RepID=UPI003CEB47FF
MRKNRRTRQSSCPPAPPEWERAFRRFICRRAIDQLLANHGHLIVPRNAAGALLAPTNVVRDAHRERLLVHSWTFRTESQFLPADFRIGADPNARGDITAEYELFLGLGLDGVFSDHPDDGPALCPPACRRPQGCGHHLADAMELMP